MFLFFIFVAALIFLYVMSIFWAKKDAKARGANEKFAMLISLIPFAGVLAYVLMRPPLLKIDEEEQNLDIKLKTRQLKKYSVCPNCGTEVEDNFIVCPNCAHKLKDVCLKCGKPLDLNWNVCPYCGEGTTRVAPESVAHTSAINEEAKLDAPKETNNKVDYKVEDSFSFDDYAVEEADVSADDASKPRHHFKNLSNKNTHK